MKALAVGCWVLAGFWLLAWVAFFAARAGKERIVRMELAAGVLGAAGLACAGAVLW